MNKKQYRDLGNKIGLIGYFALMFTVPSLFFIFMAGLAYPNYQRLLINILLDVIFLFITITFFGVGIKFILGSVK